MGLLLRRGNRGQRALHRLRGRVRIAGQLKGHERRVTVGRDLARVALVGAHDVGYALGVTETLGHVRDRRLELPVHGLEPLALDQHLLARLLRERAVQRCSGLARLSGGGGPGVDLLLRHQVEPDHHGNDYESEPPEDGLLAVLSAPAPHPRGDVLRLVHRDSSGWLTRHAGRVEVEPLVGHRAGALNRHPEPAYARPYRWTHGPVPPLRRSSDATASSGISTRPSTRLATAAPPTSRSRESPASVRRACWASCERGPRHADMWY